MYDGASIIILSSSVMDKTKLLIENFHKLVCFIVAFLNDMVMSSSEDSSRYGCLLCVP